MTAPPFEWEIVDDVMVTRNRPGDVDDAVWNRYIEELRSSEVCGTFSLVDGSITVTATQRKAAADALREKKLPAVVLLDNRLARGIVTAISWLGGNVSAFSWKDADRAVAEVSTSEETRAKLLRIVKDFQQG